jgi:cbb3-type cytochrome oxidase maturation protein
MSVLFVLIGISLLVALGFLVACLWSVGNGQYDDEDTPAQRMLFDDTIPVKQTKINQKNNTYE